MLDLGCGAGGFTRLAHGHGIRVSGLDAGAALVEIARTWTPAGAFWSATWSRFLCPTTNSPR
ncbi:methyltransferase domain-containing protein [Amycolatopsis sp. cmx-11-12]|uniref:methyltransferase domain-containing protein n=1 Tax=Amycolatopsis sp. cmx-11-12 TaxID=2785795 RepID=UPI003917F7DD